MARDNNKEPDVGELGVSTMKKLKSRKLLVVFVVLSLFWYYALDIQYSTEGAGV